MRRTRANGGRTQRTRCKNADDSAALFLSLSLGQRQHRRRPARVRPGRTSRGRPGRREWPGACLPCAARPTFSLASVSRGSGRSPASTRRCSRTGRSLLARLSGTARAALPCHRRAPAPPAADVGRGGPLIGGTRADTTDTRGEERTTGAPSFIRGGPICDPVLRLVWFGMNNKRTAGGHARPFGSSR